MSKLFGRLKRLVYDTYIEIVIGAVALQQFRPRSAE